MSKTLLVLRNEVFSLVSRPSFWFGAVGVPALMFLVYSGIAFLNRSKGDSSANQIAGFSEMFSESEDARPQGYVDQAGLIIENPKDFPVADLIGYGGENAARQALVAGEISAYYVIPPDYLDRGQVQVHTLDYNLIASTERAQALYWLINFNLLHADQRLYEIVSNPLGWLEKENVSTEDVQARQRDRGSAMTYLLPYAVMMLFYVSILSSSGLMLNSISKEKENRVLEVLIVSTNPHQLLLGKIAGLGLVGLIQVAIWAVSALLLLRMSEQSLALPSEFQLAPSILGWGLVFFILGYLVYAALMAGIGAMVPNLREASQATTIIVIPLMIPLFIISALIEKPDSLLATFFSLFPLTSPTTMMLRLSATQVPLWQLFLSVSMLIITVWLVIRAVAGLFRAQTLVSGEPFRIRRFFMALLGRF